MRIAHRLISLIAVLSAVLVPLRVPRCAEARLAGVDNNSSSSWSWSSGELEGGGGGRRSWLTAREMQAVVRRESDDNSGAPVDCCPSKLEMVEPVGGKNEQGMLVELYMDGEIRQRFYELSCRMDVLNKPCRFVDRKLYNQSRCVQKYSYTYALVRDPGGDHNHRHHKRQRHFASLPAGGWMLDYIRVRSGCACELRPKKRHKGQPHDRKKHQADAATYYESPPDN